jgi:hypothetical protein
MKRGRGREAAFADQEPTPGGAGLTFDLFVGAGLEPPFGAGAVSLASFGVEGTSPQQRKPIW